MKIMLRALPFLAVFLMFNVVTAGAETLSERFKKGNSDFGAQLGWGWTTDIPPGPNRTDLGFLFFFPNWQHNLTGVIGKSSWYQGAWFYHMEAGLAFSDRNGKFLLGWSPVMAQYVLVGAGFSMTNWKDEATRELGSEFQFLLHIGAGLEYFKKKGAYSINYRLFHVSNAGIQFPNIGLNAHTITMGMRF